jgi:hypothetical protein
MKEFDTNFEHLIIINFHQHGQVRKPKPEGINQVWISIDSNFNPQCMLLKKLTVEVGNASSKYLKDMPFSLHIIMKAS